MDSEAWQLLFFAVAALVVVLHTWRGWKLGPVRQIITILALASAYTAAYFGGSLLIPYLKPLGFPDLILRVIGGSLIATVIYFSITGLSALVFKKTSQQSIGVVRFGYGAMGALLGALFGLVNVWVFLILIRLFGTVAENGGKQRAEPPLSAAGSHRMPAAYEPEPQRLPAFKVPEPQWVRGIVAMKEAFDHGAAGAVAERVDPVPDKLYSTVAKIMQVMSNDGAVNRLVSYPGIKPLMQDPRIAALQNDPAIMRDILKRDFMALLRSEQIVKAANDPAIAALIGKFDIEKALDYAISKPDNPAPPRR